MAIYQTPAEWTRAFAIRVARRDFLGKNKNIA
jgi:hypothetical protein